MSAEVTLFSSGVLISSAQVMSGETLDTGADMYVSGGGTANDITVNNGGGMQVSGGGMASGTTLNGGALGVEGGGSAVDITVFSGKLFLTVAPDTWIQGTSAGSAFEMKDAHISGYTVNSGGALNIASGGTAEAVIINSGTMNIAPGGTVSDITVNEDVWVSVSSGASATGIVENGGYVDVAEGAVVAFASNTFSGMVMSSSLATVHSGTTAVGAILNGGWLGIYEGGSAVETTVNNGGTLYVPDGATAIGIVENGGYVDVAEGAVVTFASNTFSGLALSQWATVHSGTTAREITVKNGGQLTVFDGGRVCGLQIKEGATVSMAEGAELNFDLTERTEADPVLVNNLALIQGSPDFTVTVNSDQADGVYLLADGAAGFDRTVTVKTASGTELGIVTVGETLVTETAEYTLARSEGTLSLTVAAVVIPALATVAGSFGVGGGAFQLFDDGSAVVRTASGRTAVEGKIDPDQWEIIGAGDFSGGGTDGLLWLEKATGYVYMQNDMTAFDEVNDRTNCLGVAVEGYTMKAAGDFTGNGIDGALLQGPAFGDPEISLNYGLPVWARNDDGSAFNGWLGALVNTWQPGDPLAGDPADPADINAKNYKYDVIGVGDFNGDGVDDVMLQNTMPTEVDGVVITGSGDVFTFLTGDKAAIEAGAPPTVCYAGCAAGGWEVVGFGDFDGDGTDDALLSDGAGVAGWSMLNGQRQNDLWFGNLAAGDEIAGIADFDGDGTDDILIRSTATETLTAWLVQAGSVTGTLAIA